MADRKCTLSRRALLLGASASIASAFLLGADALPVLGTEDSSVLGKPDFAPRVVWEFGARISWQDGRQVSGEYSTGRRIHNVVVGGEFEGPRLRGRLVPGGGDWAKLQPASATLDGPAGIDRYIVFDARYILKTHDGVDIYVTNRGGKLLGASDGDLGPASGDPPVRRALSTPVFDAPVKSAYAFLNKNVYVAMSEARKSDTILHVFRISN